jgi:anti-sigma factor RsiW
MAHLSHPTCDIGELLSAYLDGELRPGELEVVAGHLDGCEPCVAEFRQLKEARTAIRLVPMLQVPDRVIRMAHYGDELSAFLDGELATSEHQILSTHLQKCAECRHELQALDSSRTAVRSLPTLEPPVLLDVEREMVRSRLSPRRLVGAAVGVAAAITLVGALTGTTEPAQPVDLDAIADRHIARASVDAGFSVVPAGFVPGGAP